MPETLEVAIHTQTGFKRAGTHKVKVVFPGTPFVFRGERVEIDRGSRREEVAIRKPRIVGVGYVRNIRYKTGAAEMTLRKGVVHGGDGLRGLVRGGLGKGVRERSRCLRQETHRRYRGLPRRQFAASGFPCPERLVKSLFNDSRDGLHRQSIVGSEMSPRVFLGRLSKEVWHLGQQEVLEAETGLRLGREGLHVLGDFGI